MSKSFKTTVECHSKNYYKIQESKEFFGFSAAQDSKQLEILADEVANFVAKVNEQVIEKNKMLYMELSCSWQAEVNDAVFSRSYSFTSEGDVIGLENYEDFSELQDYVNSLDA